MFFVKSVIIIVEIIIAYLLQTSVFTGLRLADVVPDILMILTASLAYIFGKKSGALTGLLCGMILDCTFGSLIGLYALLYCTIGYMCGYAHVVYDETDYTLPYFVIGGAEFLLNLLYYVLFYFLKGDLDIGYFMVRYLFPRVIYTVLVSILLYRLINLNNNLFTRLMKKKNAPKEAIIFKGFDVVGGRRNI